MNVRVTDEIPALVRRLIDSDDSDEVRRLRQQLNALIRARMDELRNRAAKMTEEIRKREALAKNSEPNLKKITVLAEICRDCYSLLQ